MKKYQQKTTEVINAPAKTVKQKASAKTIADNNIALTAKLLKGVKHAERKTLLNPTDKSQVRNIDGEDIT